jgi:glycosyltransferase involved in cell wall biosynthesis
MVLLSVVVPAHDVARLVPDTIRSLDLAVRPGTEVVAVDDGSSDGTGEVLRRLARTRPWLGVLRHDTARGVSAARNTGTDAARGRYLTFVDGDDWVARDHLEALLAGLQRLDVDFVRTDHVRVWGRRREPVRAPEARRGVALSARASILPLSRSSMVDYPLPVAGLLDRRRLAPGLLRFDPDLPTAEDREWIWRLHLGAERYAVLPRFDYFYRRGVGTSLTQVGDARQLGFFDAYDRIARLVAADRDARAFLPKVVRTYCALMVFHWRRRDRLSRPVSGELARRARATLTSLPPDVLGEVLAGMDTGRVRTLRRLGAPS